MATFLELCKATAQECGIGDADGTVPVTVVNQSGELKRVVDWVKQAWTDLQNRQEDWRWMRVGFTIETVAADDTYAYGDAVDDLTGSAITRFGRWRVDDYNDYAKVYLQSAGIGTQTWLSYLDWNSYKTIFRIGSNVNTQSYPAFVTIDPQNNLVLGPKPNDVYVIAGDYQRGPQILSADADVPEMPTRFHDLIMYLAMEKYALYEAADEVLARSRYGIASLRGRLEADQLPDMPMAPPLA